MIVCIDGPAGSGKSTVSRMVAELSGFLHLDTGAIYRSLALFALDRGIAWDDESGLSKLAANLPIVFVPNEDGQKVLLDNEDVSEKIRSSKISLGSSQVAAHGKVRRALLDLQRRIGHSDSCVIEGRDTGTVVFPKAELKIYLDASPEERAERRHRELLSRGEKTSYAQVLADVMERDRSDSQRDIAPLKPADDAIILDTTTLTIDEVVDGIRKLIGDASETR